MLVMRTPCTRQSKACVWCCYHGGHATTLSCHVSVCVRGHSRQYFDVTCVSLHRVSLRQYVSHAPQPVLDPRLICLQAGPALSSRPAFKQIRVLLTANWHEGYVLPAFRRKPDFSIAYRDLTHSFAGGIALLVGIKESSITSVE